MKYYQVKKEYDNKDLYAPDGTYALTLIEYNLYTETEIMKLLHNGKLSYKYYNKFFDIVEYPKHKSYWFFGCRFNADQVKD